MTATAALFQVFLLTILPAPPAGAQEPGRAILLPHSVLIRHDKTLAVQGPRGFFGPIAFSPDGKLLAASFPNPPSKIVFWDPEDGRVVKTISAPSGVGCLAFSPDGKTLAGCSNDDVLLWDVASGKSRRLWKGPRHEWATGTDFQPLDHSWVSCLAFSADGKSLAVGRRDPVRKDNPLFLLDAADGRVLRTLYCLGCGEVQGLAFSPDGRTLAAALDRDGAMLFDPATGADRGRVTFNSTAEGRVGPVGPLAFSPDGKLLATARDFGDAIDLVDLSSDPSHVARTFQRESSNGSAGAFHPAAGLLAFPAPRQSGPQNRIVLADPRSDRTLTLTAPVDDASQVGDRILFSPDGGRLAASALRGGDKMVIFLWDTSQLSAFGKGDWETTTEYQARLQAWKQPYSAPVALGRYDADQGGFPADLAGSKVFIPVPREQARTIMESKKPAFVQGTLKYADPGHLRLVNAALTDSGAQQAFVLRQAPAPQRPAARPVPAADPEMVPDFKAKPRPDDFAVVIGVESYQTVPRSEFSAADARLVKDYLVALGIPERNIEHLADSRATKSALEKTFEAWLPNRVKKTSRVVVYYSGHGAPEPASGDSYLVPYDGDPDYLVNTGYPLKRLYDDLGRLGAGEVVVVLDSCFSGAGGRSVLAKGARPLVHVSAAPRLPRNVVVLSASSGSQISTSSPEKGHGLFTYYLLRALQDGRREAAQIHAYLVPLVQDEAKRLNVQQRPAMLPDEEGVPGFSLAR